MTENGTQIAIEQVSALIDLAEQNGAITPKQAQALHGLRQSDNAAAVVQAVKDGRDPREVVSGV